MIIITSYHEETEHYVFCKHSTGLFLFKKNLIQVAVQPVEMEIVQEMFLPKVVI